MKFWLLLPQTLSRIRCWKKAMLSILKFLWKGTAENQILENWSLPNLNIYVIVATP